MAISWPKVAFSEVTQYQTYLNKTEMTCVLISIEVQPMTHSLVKKKIMLCVYAVLVDS